MTRQLVCLMACTLGLLLLGTTRVAAQEIVNSNVVVTPGYVSPYYYPYTSTYYSGPIPGISTRYYGRTGYYGTRAYAGRSYAGYTGYRSTGYRSAGYRTTGYRSAGYGYRGFRR